MRTTLFTTAALTLLAANASAMSVEDVPNPRSSGGWVSDTAQMLSPTEELELNAMITVAEQQTSAEIAVVTVDDVDTATPKDFATKLFNHWGIGKKTANNGLLVLMVKDQRRLEMETGYGTETVLTDGWLKTMQERDMVPRFKEGAYGEGITNGVALSIERLTAYETTGEIVDPGDTGGGGFPGWLLYLLGGGGLVGGGGAIVGRKRWRKARTCPDCGEMMAMLPEEQDDEHLTEGQQTEEAIGSMDWEYWYCDKDQTHALIGVGKMFSGFTKCAQCGNKTRSSTTNTLAYPTQQSTGTAEVISQCAHCDFYSRTIRTLPRLPKPSSSSYSSSSSSGGSSFGGGSSGGGGAGSSW